MFCAALPCGLGRKKGANLDSDEHGTDGMNRKVTVSKASRSHRSTIRGPNAAGQQQIEIEPNIEGAPSVEAPSFQDSNSNTSPVLPITSTPTVALDPVSGNEMVGAPPKRFSCWAQANEELKNAKPEVFSKLHKDLPQSQDIGKDPNDLMSMAIEQKKSANPLPRWLEHSIRSVLQFKDIFAAAATLDPFKCAPIVWRTLSFVLEACVNQPALQQTIAKDLINVTSWISSWENVE
ncbi:hypothetical protein EJ04DRAFT_249268 [Polyplosphaeria fusca]|uniref:Uncharacterized protein n=1 Tax=Polyplosphaeria fusca TaxID=682080 RepID=A0A9P4V2G6_9PLEO|nr:hypothetical protein EJ04DRAFT_249268 [Polyplosphaeria fusca]